MLTIIVPTRGRPQSALELVDAVLETRQIETTNVILAVDKTDPTMTEYKAIEKVHLPGSGARVEPVTGGWMVAALNEAATRVVATDPRVTAVAFLGDDHRPRTPGWDAAYLSALNAMGAGIVYGDDLLQHEFVPTQCAMSADIIRRLGWMAHPGLKHMYVDTLWRDMADVAGKRAYLPDVVVEHLHYINGKSVEDEHYKRVNDRSVYEADERVFRALHSSGQIRRAGALIAQLAREAGK